MTGSADAAIHTVAGWVFTGIALLGVLAGWRAARSLLTDSVRFRRTEMRWFARWPRAVVTGRFGRHEGHFDPGQRVANLVMIAAGVLPGYRGVWRAMHLAGLARAGRRRRRRSKR